ncbi:MAG: Abi family protein [Bifidobacteriaceae bacterium]|jgi:abortive infection bacteriophage resistance protein|nr:Abi family protein [Bifidobacteriaceae bacterium]
MTYAKPHLSYAQQLALLKSRGLVCSDDARATRTLELVGYYNFTGYLHSFRLPDPSDPNCQKRLDQVRPGILFEDVASLLEFDRALRGALLKGIQLVEVGVRSRIAYVLGKRDPFGHTNAASLDPRATRRSQVRGSVRDTAFSWWLSEYARLQGRAQTEPYVGHNLAKYGPPLPIWIACEFFDFGAVTRLYQFLVHADRQAIAASAGLTRERTLRSWLTTANYVRNICAHNARLWNRRLIQQPMLQTNDLPASLQHLTGTPSDKVYAVLAITAYLTDHLSPEAQWRETIVSTLTTFPTIAGRSTGEMGVPTDWTNKIIWKQEGHR